MISSRPITDLAEANDDLTLDNSYLKNKIKFDTLYYYKVSSPEDISEAKGSIDIK